MSDPRAGAPPATWDPVAYLRFDDERGRPASDLLARVPLDAPRSVVDLGCGTGNSTARLRARWPGARITGVDRSAEMLARARADGPDADWLQADIADWLPPAPVDLVFSNAALHWVERHEHLLPRLVGCLAPGGALAVQVPANTGAPTHRELFALARTARWSARLAGLVRERPVLEPEAVHDLLAPLVSRLDLWTTTYLHVLSGPDPVLAWTRGTTLRPFLGRLAPPEAVAFEADYSERLAAAYPPRADGRVLLPFRRHFLVAVR